MQIQTGLVDCKPEEIGFAVSRLTAINDFFIRMIKSKVIFGVSYHLARRGKIFAAASIGCRHYGNPDLPMLPNTVFRLASQSKLFTIVAMHILAEDGLISIDDKVAKYLEQFDGAPYNEITLLHLLTHTSGLYAHPGCIPDKHHVDAYSHIRTAYEQEENFDWIAAGLRAGLRRKPGEEWMCSNFGMELLGAVIEKVTGEKYRDYITAKIFKPLEMTNTSYALTPDAAQNTLVFNEWNEKDLTNIVNGIKPDLSAWTHIPPGGSGAYSTTGDMIRFGIMLSQWGRLGDVRILGRKSIESMTTQRLINIPDNCWNAEEPDRKYGVGVDMRRFPSTLYSQGTYLHEGAGHSVLIVDPKEEMVCSCVYPWVNGEFNNDCNSRLYNVMWSGLL